MKKIFLLIVSTLVTLGALQSNAQEADTAVSTYGMHLFFNEQEFIDVFTLYKDENGELKGDMHVPDDFDGPLLNIKLEKNTLSFDLLVPKNAARPQDLIFHYTGTFHSSNHQQLIGYVNIKGQSDFVASFVAFKRSQN